MWVSAHAHTVVHISGNSGWPAQKSKTELKRNNIYMKVIQWKVKYLKIKLWKLNVANYLGPYIIRKRYAKCKCLVLINILTVNKTLNYEEAKK